MLHRNLNDRDDNKWGNSMPSSSRRGSYTSGNNSSQSSIDSNANSQSTHGGLSQGVNDSTGAEYDALFSATLFLDRTIVNSNNNRYDLIYSFANLVFLFFYYMYFF